MEEVNSYPTVRLVDIEKEILKGKKVKPGILHDDVLPGPSKLSKLTVAPITTDHISSSVAAEGTVVNTLVIDQTSPNLVSTPASFILNPVQQANVVQQTVQPQIKYVTAVKQTPIQWNKPSILRKPPPVATQAIPVDQTWSEIKNGIRFLHPSNLDYNVLNQVSDSLKTKKSSLKNTIISLPNSVYLVPLSYFQGAQLPPDSMVSIASSENRDECVNDNVECVQTKTEIEETQPLRHPCWNRKRHRKLDLDGFTAYDRLGFYKAEVARTKKCHRTIEAIMGGLASSMIKIQNELTRIKLKTSGKPLKRRKCFTKKILPADLRKIATKSSVVSKLLNKNNTRPIIDYNNFETFKHYKSCVFVNRDTVVTQMILYTFPNFKTAVENGVVKVISESELECDHKTVKKCSLVVPATNRFDEFVKFLKDSHSLLDVMNDHSYAAIESDTCMHTSNELLRTRKKSVSVNY